MSNELIDLLLSDISLTTESSPRIRKDIKNANQLASKDPEILYLSENIKHGSYSPGYDRNLRELEIRRLLFLYGFEQGIKAALKLKK